MTTMSMVLAAAAMAGESVGWRGYDPAWKPAESGAKVYWRVPATGMESAFDVRKCDGAEGTVSFADGAITVEKSNSVGYILIEAKEGISAPAGLRLRNVAEAEVVEGDADDAIGFLRVLGRERVLHACIDLDLVPTFIGGGPQTGYLIPMPPGMSQRKLSGYVVRPGDADLHPALVVAGAPSKSVWRSWTVEDYDEAGARWNATEKARPRTLPPADVPTPEAALDGMLAADVDHEARVVADAGGARLLVDGKPVYPALYKCCHGTSHGSTAFNFRGMSGAGVNIDVVGIKFGRAKDARRGFWTVDGFELKRAVEQFRWEVSLAPTNYFVLSLETIPYPEFASEHPDEIWRTWDGKIVGSCRGSSWSVAYDPEKPLPEGCNAWVSMMSPSWRRELKRHLADLLAELKRTGLSKRLIGVHFAGFHDNQFAMHHPDYSEPSAAAFRAYLRERGLEAPADMTPPVFPADKPYLEPGKDDLAIHFNQYLHRTAFRMQEEFARHVRKCLGKNVVTIRWCMGPFSGYSSGSYDIGAFTRSRDVDVLVAQPEYTRRRPSLPIACTVPLASFNRRGKIYLDEFDLRTYGRVAADEISQQGLSNADNPMAWRSLHRKLTGLLVSQRQGWWYYDIFAGFFDPPEIRADIAGTVADATRLAAGPFPSWRPSVAVVVDEDGRLLHNPLSSYDCRSDCYAYGEQLHVMAASGVPFDVWLAEDAMCEPSPLADRKVVVLAGFYAIDARRRRFVERLREKGCTVVYLSGTACAGGAESIGFKPVFRPEPSCHELVPEKGVNLRLASRHHSEAQRWMLKLGGGDYYRHYNPSGFSVEEAAGVSALARYRDDGKVAIAARRDGGVPSVYVAEGTGLTPELLNLLTRRAGGYVPLAPRIAQVDMSGEFVSLHALRNGRVDFLLPFPARVVNMKTGKEMPTGGGRLAFDVLAGETCWFALKASGASNENAKTNKAKERNRTP
ncbi:MAG: hypothetical protein IKE55_07620 [Kiritimatiellae bacterium]|nr:hypothetical protein [Kiritimatiellia bacterium]